MQKGERPLIIIPAGNVLSRKFVDRKIGTLIDFDTSFSLCVILRCIGMRQNVIRFSDEPVRGFLVV